MHILPRFATNGNGRGLPSEMSAICPLGERSAKSGSGHDYLSPGQPQERLRTFELILQHMQSILNERARSHISVGRCDAHWALTNPQRPLLLFSFLALLAPFLRLLFGLLVLRAVPPSPEHRLDSRRRPVHDRHRLRQFGPHRRQSRLFGPTLPPAGIHSVEVVLQDS